MDEVSLSDLTVGRIVWAQLLNSARTKREHHPAVIMVPPSNGDLDTEFQVLGISTIRPKSGKEADYVRLPYMNRGGGHPDTQLKRESWVHCRWPDVLRVRDIHTVEDVGGFVGGKYRKQINDVLARISQEVAAAKAAQQSPGEVVQPNQDNAARANSSESR